MPLPTAYGTVPIGGALPEAYIDPFIPISTTDGANNLPTGYGVLIPAVSMTAAASGSSGITVADDDDIDFGTGNFTIHWEGALPDYSPATDVPLYFKYQNASNFNFVYVTAAQKLRCYARVGGVVVIDKTTAASIPATDNAAIKITVVCTRETASAAGTAVFYTDGTLLGSQSITAAATASLSNTGILDICGNSSVGARYASTTRACYLYNRALSAAEVLSLCNNGVASADTGASQTSLVPSPLDFTSGWNVTGTASITDADTISLPANGDSVRRSFTVSTSKNYRLRLVGTTTQIIRITDNSLTNVIISSIAAGAFDITLETTLAANGIAVRNISGVATTVDFTTFTLRQIGCTLQLEPPGLTASGLTWTDSSGNGNNGTLPAAGATKVTIRK